MLPNLSREPFRLPSLSRTAAGVFTPRRLFAAGANGAWFDATDQATLFRDAAGTIPVSADGDPVGLWRDKSGHGLHAAQASAASRPLWRTSGGLAWLQFDGVDDFLLTAATTIGQPFTVWAAATTGTLTSPADRVLYAPISGSVSGLLQRNDAHRLKAHAGTTLSSGVAPTINAPFATIHRYNGAGSSISFNGTEVSGNAGAGALAVAEELYLGKSGFAGTNWSGRIYQFGFVDRALTATERAALRLYLAGKCGIAL